MIENIALIYKAYKLQLLYRNNLLRALRTGLEMNGNNIVNLRQLRNGTGTFTQSKMLFNFLFHTQY